MIDAAEARNEIRRLMFAYTDALDGGDLDAVASIFAHAKVRVDGANGGAIGAVQVREFFSAVTFYKGGDRCDQDDPASTPATQHLTSNVYIEVDADGLAASARSRFTVFQACPNFPLQPIIAGRYQDRFEHHNGRWRFAERVEFIDLIGDLAHHLDAEFRETTALKIP